MAGWITPADVALQLGPGTGWEDDPALQDAVVAAANAFAFRRRREAGWDDDPDVSPGPDVTWGTATYAVSLFRERATTDGFGSFDDLAGFQPTGGAWTSIRKNLAIGRAQTDHAPDDADVNPLRVRRPFSRTGGWPL